MKRTDSMWLLLCALLTITPGCPSEKSPDQSQQEEQKQSDQVESSKLSVDLIDEIEPNSNTNQAMEITTSTTVSANLEAATGTSNRARDWYKIAPASKQLVRIEVSGVEKNDVNLTVLDADKNRLFTLDSAAEGESEVLPNLTVENGAYVSISGTKGGQPGAYRLVVKMTDPVAGEEVETNDRYSLANPIGVGGEIRGYLGHRKDEDWYLLDTKELPSDSVLRIEVTGVEGLRPSLEILDHAQRAPIFNTRSSEIGKGMVIRNLGLPEADDAIYLAVKSAWVPAQGSSKYVQTFNTETTYALSVSSEAGASDLEREPNDDADHAIILLDGQSIRGYLSDPSDVDWYKINVERPSLLSALLSGLDRVDLQLYVVDPEEKEERKDFELMRINDGRVNEEEVLTNCCLQPGENYIRVEGAWKKVDEKWVRDFYNLDETYSLTLNLRSDDGREEREPNNQVEQATPVKVEETLRGTLHPMGDKDLYRLDLSSMQGPQETLIQCTGIAKLDISITLLGPEKDERGQLKILSSSDAGRGESKEEIQTELVPGVYHIMVRGKPYTASNTADNYVLTVSQP